MLETGTRIGPYEVLGPLGAGGMGEVYRARDSRLGRDVALKILPAAVAQDPDRLARFEREARTLAALDHPNIASIHDLEEGGGIRALVMELVPGEDLSHRIERGALPPDEALAIARQVAEALEAAHGAGITHRDLKPANIRIRPDGTVRVIDFGLAKASGPSEASGATSADDVTMTSPAMTAAGIILGTAAYMSPEQAKGKSVDHRADIWAFGAVLFEMLAGKAPFDGESLSERLAAVLKEEPDWQALPPGAASVHHLLRRCLTKDPRRRLQSIGDARIEIEDALGGGGQVITAPATPLAGSSRGLYAALGVLALAAVTGWAAVFLGRGSANEPSEIRLSVPMPGHGRLGANTGTYANWDVSPDGRQVVLAPFDRDGQSQLWVQALDAGRPRLLVGTEGGSRPFFSPDGESIGFQADGKVKAVPTEGGPVRTLCECDIPPLNFDASWGSRGSILVSDESRVRSVAAGGGTPAPVDLGPDPVGAPNFLPDGRRFLFLRRPAGGERGIYVGSLDGDSPYLLVPTDYPAHYVEPGLLMYIRDSVLVVQPVQDGPLRLTGTPRPLVENVASTTVSGQAAYRVTHGGVLTYRTRSFDAESRLELRDRLGNGIGDLGPSAAYIVAEYSRSRRRLAIARQAAGATGNDEPASEIVWRDLSRSGVEVRFVPDDVRSAENPIWSPDEQFLAFAAHPRGDNPLAETRIRRADGTGRAAVVASGLDSFHPLDWSPDGRHLLLVALGSVATSIWRVEARAGSTPEIYISDPGSDEGQARFSPDGAWVAYTSTRTGSQEVYIERFPDGGDRIQVSGAGGGQPRWNPNGRELFYVAPDSTLMAVPITIGTSLSAGTPVPLFRAAFPATDMYYYGAMAGYDVGPDGERFLVNAVIRPPDSGPLMVALNWQQPGER